MSRPYPRTLLGTLCLLFLCLGSSLYFGWLPSAEKLLTPERPAWHPNQADLDESAALLQQETQFSAAPKPFQPASLLPRAEIARQAMAWEDFMQGREVVFLADGRARWFKPSFNELHLPQEKENRLRTLPPEVTAAAFLKKAEELGGPEAELIFYPDGYENQPAMRHVLKPRIAVIIENRQAAEKTFSQLHLVVKAEPSYAANTVIVEPQKKSPQTILMAISALQGAAGIKKVQPLLARHHRKFVLPNDPLFTSQWHLRNTGQGGGTPGADMRVLGAWDNYRGNGVVIGIVDDGLQIKHPDLAPNAAPLGPLHYDFNDQDSDPSPHPHWNRNLEDSHGTSVGGVAAARGRNFFGVTGVAPEATLAGLRLISVLDEDGTTDEDDANAMSHANDSIHIKNNSWGSAAPDSALPGPGELMEQARKDATEIGRGGLGTIFIWAAGNSRAEGELGQKDGYTNSMYVTAVSALTNRGGLSFYSETGPHIVISAPSNGGTRSIYSTDLMGTNGYNRRGTRDREPINKDYTSSFGGTSSASPAVAGAVALILEANPNLSWRDVKEILLRSAVKIFPSDSGWTSRTGGNPKLPLIKHHSSYGGGRIDVSAAVKLARDWVPLSSMTTVQSFNGDSRFIPDNNTRGITIPFDMSGYFVRTEHVEVILNVNHTFRGDLEIQLISPNGVKSTLAAKRAGDGGDDYPGKVFTSVRHWGELAEGQWKLVIKDLAFRDQGYYLDATLKIHGTTVTTPSLDTYTAGPLLLKEADPLTLSASSSGSDTIHRWKKGSTYLTSTGDDYSVQHVSLADAGVYQVSIHNAVETHTSNNIQVAVIGDLPASQGVKLGSTLRMTARMAGNGLSCQWLRNGEPLENGPSPSEIGIVQGADTPNLIITKMQADDLGTFSYRVTMQGLAGTLTSSAIEVIESIAPELPSFTLDTSVVGGSVDQTLSATNLPTFFSATNLPPGISLDATTGRLTGRPTRPGSYEVTFKAGNPAGNVEQRVTWVIESFPTELVGTWYASISRDEYINHGLGGKLKLTVTSQASYSAEIYLGTRLHRFTGKIQALPGRQPMTTNFSFRPAIGSALLAGSFTLTYNTPHSTLLGDLFGNRAASEAQIEGGKDTWTLSRPLFATSRTYNAHFQPGAPPPDLPQGISWARLTVTPSGSITWAGRLATNTSFTGSASLIENASFFLHNKVHLRTGSLQGWLTLDHEQGNAESAKQFTGTLDWFKAPAPSNTTSRSYKAGIPLHELECDSYRYRPPEAGIMLFGLTPPSPATQVNAELIFTLGALTDGSIQQPIQIRANNTTRIPSGTENPHGTTVTLDPTTGRLSGKFSLSTLNPETNQFYNRAATFEGLVNPDPENNRVIGFFTLAEEPAPLFSGSLLKLPILSGHAELLPLSQP